MGSRGAPIAITVVAITLMLIGVLHGAWWTATVEHQLVTGELRLGLRTIGVCAQGQCIEISLNGLEQKWLDQLLANGTYFGGIIAAIALALGVYLRELHDVDGVASLAGKLCVGVFGLATLAALTMYRGGQIEASLGYPAALALAGAGLGAFAGLARMGSSSWRDGVSHAPASSDADGRSFFGQGFEVGPHGTMAPLPPGEVAAREAAPAPRAPAPRAPVASSPPGGLRFAARHIDISHAGITATLESGGQRDLPWSDVGTVHARRLPQGSTLVVDLIPATPPLRPIRVLATTRANYAALPGGPAETPEANLRGLITFVRARNPDVIVDDGSPGFSAGGDAPAYPSMQAFSEYDAQYG